MKANHSDYDEFQFQIDEIGHNPYQLISYLTVKYGGFTYAEVADEIQEIFKEQYGLYTDSTRETVTEKKKVRVGNHWDRWLPADIVTVQSVAGSGVVVRLQVAHIHRLIIRLQ